MTQTYWSSSYHLSHRPNNSKQAGPSTRTKAAQLWDIKETKILLGPTICQHALFLRAILGCDTVSRVHGLGKGQVLKKLHSDTKDRYFCEQALIFTDKHVVKDDVVSAGDKALLSLYGEQPGEGLNDLHYRKFLD